MRASVACLPCRGSKIKCQNVGWGIDCTRCKESNKKCEWAHTTTSTTGLQRSDVTDGDGPPRKRRKNLAPTTSAKHQSSSGLGATEDALNASVLTAKVWGELFVIYEQHVAIDFPFFHKRRFLEQMSPSSSAPSRPNHTPPLLLAFLTQTARFHPEFVALKGGKPEAVAEFYADATRTSMGFDFPGQPTIEKIQTLLLLGYYEWTARQGQSGFVRCRTAISCAQALKLHNVDGDQAIPITDSNKTNATVLREIQRRTFWSCYLLDRYLSFGRHRPHVLQNGNLEAIQLPCSDRAFKMGRPVKTRRLGESEAEYKNRRESVDGLGPSQNTRRSTTNAHQRYTERTEPVYWETGADEEELNWYIEAVDHMREIVQWACHGGRTREKDPPWNENTDFYKLEVSLKSLKRALPDHLTLTPDNTNFHIWTESWGKYFLIHAVLTMATVSLYREYVPFCPFEISCPQGPKDEPLIRETLPEDKPDYWGNQAKDLFGSCRDFAELLQVCQRNNRPVETGIAAFAAYTVGWCAVYCCVWPRMDPAKALQGTAAWDTVNAFLFSIRDRIYIAENCMEELQKIKDEYMELRKRYRKAGGSPDSVSSNNGADLINYRLHFEMRQKEYGSLEERDRVAGKRIIDLQSTKLKIERDSEDRHPTASPSLGLKSEGRSDSADASGASPAASQSQFTPVNAPAVPVTTGTTMVPPLDASALPNEYSGTQSIQSSAYEQPMHTYQPTVQPYSQAAYQTGPVSFPCQEQMYSYNNSLQPLQDGELMQQLIQFGRQPVRRDDFETFSEGDFGYTSFSNDWSNYSSYAYPSNQGNNAQQ